MKSLDESRARTHGLFNITVSPFGADGSLDLNALSENIERVLAHGYDGLLIGGTYGEFPGMNADERAQLFRQAMSVVGDRVPVLLCTAHFDVRVVRELTVLASDLGGLPMLMAPFVSEVTDDQIFAFFKELAPLSKTGVMIYNAPGVGITLPVPLIERLCDIEQVVALKQGDLNPTTVDQLVGCVSLRIRVLAASDLVMLGPLVLGFDGVSSTNSCAIPELVKGTYDALRGGDAARAGELHRRWYALRAAARKLGQPQSTKAAMNLRGWRGGHVRRPLLDLDAAGQSQVRDALLAAGIALAK
ncbi:MAG: dihydrodipicolinate synthetase [Proteobacteria bacterium]|nr:dihydrodipicolinate synthetase [Pseudomonadota bacterium]